MVPLPAPFEPLVIVIQEALLVADQAHAAGADTVMVPDDELEPTFTDVGATVKLHVMPGCVTVTTRLPIAIVADRDDVLVFAAA
jgi:hypothetical protein